MNRVILEGHAGKDAEVKFTPSGKMVCTFSLATSNDYKDKQTDEWIKQPPTWHNITSFGKVAEELADVKKGGKIKVQGKIQYRDWTDKQGNKRSITEILVFRVGEEEPF